MSYVLVLLMAIDVVDVILGLVLFKGAPTLLLYPRG
jgi:hypothetical protein